MARSSWYLVTSSFPLSLTDLDRYLTGLVGSSNCFYSCTLLVCFLHALMSSVQIPVALRKARIGGFVNGSLKRSTASSPSTVDVGTDYVWALRKIFFNSRDTQEKFTTNRCYTLHSRRSDHTSIRAARRWSRRIAVVADSALMSISWRRTWPI